MGKDSVSQPDKVSSMYWLIYSVRNGDIIRVESKCPDQTYVRAIVASDGLMYDRSLYDVIKIEYLSKENLTKDIGKGLVKINIGHDGKPTIEIKNPEDVIKPINTEISRTFKIYVVTEYRHVRFRDKETGFASPERPLGEVIIVSDKNIYLESIGVVLDTCRYELEMYSYDHIQLDVEYKYGKARGSIEWKKS